MRKPWSSPSYIPGAPHNLPVRPLPQATTADTYIPPSETTVDIRDQYRYASLISVSLTVGTTGVKFLDAPVGKRNFLGFRNASAGTQIIYIDFQGFASTSSWLALQPNTIVLFDTCVPQDDLYALSSAASGVLSYVYSTFPG